jgi:activator of HSP90 ATPase
MSSIHQELTFEAPAQKVFLALADAAEFAKMTGAPATGKPAEGEVFSIFGGHIVGRQIELVPGKRVVQAWRPKTWPDGMYSVARFELAQEGNKTRMVFDHEGFPEDMKEHLTAGWEENYWKPMRKSLGG